jgi:hypothetical protein
MQQVPPIRTPIFISESIMMRPTFTSIPSDAWLQQDIITEPGEWGLWINGFRKKDWPYFQGVTKMLLSNVSYGPKVSFTPTNSIGLHSLQRTSAIALPSPPTMLFSSTVTTALQSFTISRIASFFIGLIVLTLITFTEILSLTSSAASNDFPTIIPVANTAISSRQLRLCLLLQYPAQNASPDTPLQIAFPWSNHQDPHQEQQSSRYPFPIPPIYYHTPFFDLYMPCRIINGFKIHFLILIQTLHYIPICFAKF